MSSQLTFKQDIVKAQQLHEHKMDEKRHRLLVTGQVWAGSLATIGVTGSVTALLIGAGGFAATVMSAEFVALIGLFLYRKKAPEVQSSVSPEPAAIPA